MNTSKHNEWNDNDCLIILLYTFLNYECPCTFFFVAPTCDEMLRHIDVLLSLLYHRRHNQNNTILCSRYLTSKNIRSSNRRPNPSIAILVQNWTDHSHHANLLLHQQNDRLFCSSFRIPTIPSIPHQVFLYS